MTQLVRIEPGNTVEEAHMRNRQLIARWVFEKGAADKVVENHPSPVRISDSQNLCKEPDSVSCNVPILQREDFGVELPRIKMIAEGYEKNHDLAQALWKENIRECKIMAAMLQPIDTFYPEIADIWVEDIQNIEIAELTCMNLFQHLPYAPAKSLHWIADEQEYVQTCGFKIQCYLLLNNKVIKLWSSPSPYHLIQS